MSDSEKMTELEAAELRLKKAKEKLAAARKKETRRKFKERTTALVTVGACWAYMLENDPDQAHLIWKYLKKAAPRDYFKTGRIDALRNQFGLDVQMSEKNARPPAAE